MRILLLKFCGNIKFGDVKETNGGNTEIEVVLDSLKKNHEVTVVTISRYLKNLPEGINGITWDYIDADRINEDYDLVFAFNGSLNNFGGVISNETLISYRIFNAADIPIIYAITDTNIPIGNLASWIRGAHGKGKYSELNDAEYEVDGRKISALTQTYDFKAITENWTKPECQFKKFVYFPFEKTVFFREALENQICLSPNDQIIYFGNSRGGKRDKKFNDFYCHLNTHAIVYGNWDEEKLKTNKKFPMSAMPIFMGKKDMYLLHKDINTSVAHCYISDPVNEGTIWTTRFYETILNRTVLFMDKANDKEMKKFSTKFFYVQDGYELDQKLQLLKKNPDFRVKLIEEQYASLDTDRKFVNNFDQMLDYSIRKCL